MFCPHCGSNAVDAHGICQECGQETFDSSTNLEVQAISTETGGNCLNCGASLESGEPYCGQCGTRVSAAPASGPPSVSSPFGRPSTSQRRTRGALAPTGIGAQRAYWDNAVEDEGEAPTEAFRRMQTPRPSLRSNPIGDMSSRGPLYRPVPSTRLPTGKPYLQPAPRSHATLVIGLLCFLASFISGGAAIWLALSLH